MGNLKPEIADGIRMFRPKMLKDAISLARMRNEQLLRQKEYNKSPQVDQDLDSFTPMSKSNTTPSVKRLSWEEMQKRRAQGLCFNCNEKFVIGHNCRGQKPQLMLLGTFDEMSYGSTTEELENEP